MKLLKKFFVFSAVVGIVFFSGCSNFMNGSDLKKQIDETIADSEFYSIKRPAILNTNPMNGARNIARNSSVRVVFSDELNTAALDLDSSTIENISQENLIKAGDGTDHIVGYIKNGQKIFNKIKITMFSGTQELPAENYFNAPYIKRNYIELWPDTNNVIPANSEVKIEVSLDIKNKDGIEAGKPTDFYTWTYNYGDRIENTSPVITALDTEFENPVETYNFDSINAYLISTDDNNNDQYDVKLTIKYLDNDTGFAAGDNQTVIITEEVVSDFSIPLRNGEKSSTTVTTEIKECVFGNIVTDSVKYVLSNKNDGVYKISVIVLDDNGAASDHPEDLYFIKSTGLPDSTLALSNSTLTDEEYIVDSNDLPDEDSDDAYKQFILEKLWKKCLTFDITLTSPLIQIEGKSYDLDCTIESLTLECGDTLIAELSGDILNKYLDLENKKLNLTSYKKILEKVENDLILKFSVKDIFGKTNVVPFTVCRKNSIASLYANYNYGPGDEFESFLNIHLSDSRKTNLKVLYYPLDKPNDNDVDKYESFSYFKWKNSKTSKDFKEITNHIKDNIDYIGSGCYYTLRIFNQIKEKNIYGFPDSTDYNTGTPSRSVAGIFLPGKKTSITPDGKNSNSYNVRLEINYKGYENYDSVKDYLLPPDSTLSLLMNDLAVLPKHDRDNKIIVIEYKVPPATTPSANTPSATTDYLGSCRLTYFSGLNDGKLYYIWDNILYCGYDVTAPYFENNKLTLSDPFNAWITPPKDDKAGFLWQSSKVNCNYYFAEYKNYWNGYKDILTEEEIKKLPLQGTTYFDSSKLYIPLNNLPGKYLLCIDVEDNAKNFHYTSDTYSKTEYSQRDYYGSDVFNNNFCNGITVVNSERFQNKAEFTVSGIYITAQLDVSPQADKDLTYKLWINQWNNSYKKYDMPKGVSSTGVNDKLTLKSSLSLGAKWNRFQITGEKSTEEESTFVFSEPEFYYNGTNSYTLKNVTDDKTFGITIWCDKSTFYRVLSSPYDYGNDFTKWSKYAKTVKEDEISTNTSIDVSAVPQGEYYVIQAYFSDAQKTKWMSEVHKQK